MKQLMQKRINPGDRVIGRGGSKLGTVQQPIYDPETGALTAFTLRRGRLRRVLKLVPAEQIKQINAESGAVIVYLTKQSLGNLMNARPSTNDKLPVEVSLPRPTTTALNDGA